MPRPQHACLHRRYGGSRHHHLHPNGATQSCTVTFSVSGAPETWTVPASLTSSGEGILTLNATCKDVALNQRTVPYTVKVDKRAPLVTVTGVSNGAAYEVGAVPTAACSTTDALSGMADSGHPQPQRRQWRRHWQLYRHL